MQTGEWPTPWTLSSIITLPKKGNQEQCQNYRTISLISCQSNVMLKIILNRFKPQAEKIIPGEQAGFRAGRNNTEQIFNPRVFCEKHIQHQQTSTDVFIDFKQAFDRVLHAVVWATMKKYNISANLIQVIRHLSPVQSFSTAAKATGSKHQLESDKNVYSHPPSSAYF